ncbi:hypothetical protein AUC70_11680 [Methyloceanibacter stevinii]|uniref:Uncharacterized protein n=1 Tax=Methyloceanibacter stevinii TaxID=1774970 RepID=A0A1E3VJ22_9HYPH|nr:hypothetical protein [Methyloceanibacter stevinii]ODR93519.1 hypothetical protein AUC70_11680 [Methyloceanibacter stevinii]
MRRVLIALVFAAVLLTVGTVEAHAGFLVAPIVAFVGLTGTAAAVATAVGGILISVGVSYVANQLLAPDPPKPAKIDTASQRTETGVSRSVQAGGVQLDIRVDADIPQSFGVGRFVTGGSLFYAETYGSRGEIDNSDLIEGIAISDLPCTGLVQTYIDGQRVTLAASSGSRGQPVNGYDGKLALRFFDGSQTTADSYAVSKLGLHSKRPWTNKMVGRGRAYVRTHSIYDQEKVPGRMRWRFVVDGAKLYDPRKDSTVGGSGEHRFELLETHEFSRNLPLIAYNILRGLYVKDHTDARVLYYGAGATRRTCPWTCGSPL